MNILTLNSDFFKYFFKLDCKWSLPQRKHLFNFVDGIINSGGKKTLSNIWRNSLNTRDRSSFNKFLLYSPWDEKNLNYARKKTALNEMSRAGSKNPFFFSIDDTLSSKKTSSKNIEGLKFNYSHVSNKNEWNGNTFLDNFFKVIHSVLYWRLITKRRVDSVVVKPVNII